MSDNTQLIAKFQEIYNYTNFISFILSIILFIFILFTRILGFKASKRLNYKLYLWTMLIDIINHLPVQFTWKLINLPCKIYLFINYYVNLVSILLIVSLAYNIHMVFLINRPGRVKTELGCLIWVFLIASVISLPFLITLILSKSCYDIINYTGYLGILKMFGLVGGYYFVFTTYCLVVFLVVIKKLVSHKLMINGRNPLTNAYMKSLVTRLCLYPLIPVIIWYPHIISSIIEATVSGEIAVYVVGIQGMIATLQGSLNFLFFLFDPALNEIYKEIKLRYCSMKISLINLDKQNNNDVGNISDLETGEEIEIVYNLEESSGNNKLKIV